MCLPEIARYAYIVKTAPDVGWRWQALSRKLCSPARELSCFLCAQDLKLRISSFGVPIEAPMSCSLTPIGKIRLLCSIAAEERRFWKLTVPH